MKNLKLYESHSQYVDPEIKPNISYCRLENEVHYNPLGWETKYFTIESLEDGNNIYFKSTSNMTPKTISISNNNGLTWTSFTSNVTTNSSPIARLNTGEKILIKGLNNTYANNNGNGWNCFGAGKQYEVKGNIMSLINGDNFANSKTLTGNYNFAFLFLDSKIVSAKNLVLPATILTNHCYFAMFQWCWMLTTPPLNLPATTLANDCYRQMFAYTDITNIPNVPVSVQPVDSRYCTSMYEDCNVTQLPSFDVLAYHSNNIEEISEEEEEE